MNIGNGPLFDAEPPQVIVRTKTSAWSWILGALVGGILTAAFVGVVVWMATGIGLLHMIAGLRGGRTQISVDQPTVVRQIQQLRRLETVSYTMDKIIAGGHENAYLPKFLAGDRLLLVVHGEVVGGIDLAGLLSGDVTISGSKVSIKLPEAEIFGTRLDNAKTKVYSRDTGLFSSPDPNLESEVREVAERQLQESALQNGILKTAAENARGTILSLLQGLGFREIEIR
jgi:Protein of unknown function (DUF4230)